MCGIYPDADALTAGDEISSTYEGRHITMLESELIHPFRAGNMVNKGDPVIITLTGDATKRGHAVGVAFKTATLAADLIAVDTESIWNLNVFARDDDGAVDVNPGDPLFIHDGSDAGTTDPAALGIGDCAISKIRNLVTQIPFGYALGYIASGDLDGRIAVKVHWDPEEQQDEFIKWIAGNTAGSGKTFDIDDGSDIADGYVAGLRINYNIRGAKTGGRIRAMHVDLEANDSPIVWDLDGYSLYQEALGTATVSHLSGINLGMNNENPALSTSQFLRVYNHGAGTMNALILLANAGGVPITNLLRCLAGVPPYHGTGCTIATGDTPYFAVDVGGNTMGIPVIAVP